MRINNIIYVKVIFKKINKRKKHLLVVVFHIQISSTAILLNFCIEIAKFKQIFIYMRTADALIKHLCYIFFFYIVLFPFCSIWFSYGKLKRGRNIYTSGCLKSSLESHL